MAAAAPPLTMCGPGPLGPESLLLAATSGLGLPHDKCQPHARYRTILRNLNFGTSDDYTCLECFFDVKVEEIRCQVSTVTSFLQLSNRGGGKKQKDFLTLFSTNRTRLNFSFTFSTVPPGEHADTHL